MIEQVIIDYDKYQFLLKEKGYLEKANKALISDSNQVILLIDCMYKGAFPEVILGEDLVKKYLNDDKKIPIVAEYKRVLEYENLYRKAITRANTLSWWDRLFNFMDIFPE